MAKATNPLELRVGLLIVAGLTAVVVVILISERFTFGESYYRVTGYLQNVGGLQQNSMVTLSGIRIGQVKSVEAVQDPRGQIKVELAINTRYQLPADCTLTLTSSGFLGDSFLEFSGSGRVSTEFLKSDGTAVVVASQGFFDQARDRGLEIMAGVSDLLQPKMREDAKRLVANAAELAGESVVAVRELRGQTEHLGELLASLRDLSSQLKESGRDLSAKLNDTLRAVDHSLQNIDDQTQKIVDRSEPTLAAATTAFDRMEEFLGHGSSLLSRNQTEFDNLFAAVRRLADRGAKLIADLQEGKGVIGQLLVNPDLTKDLNDISINLTSASQQIADHPESLVFGVSNKEHIRLREKREKERMRRAFQEGFYTTPPEPEVEREEPRAASIK